MLNEWCKVLGSLSSCPRWITTPCLSFAEAEMCIGTCHQQDKLLVFIGTCGELSRPVISNSVHVERGRRGQAWHESNRLM